MDLQKINWKLFIKTTNLPSHDFFKAFSKWIPDSSEVFVDVVDYAHMPEGPVIFLAGHHVDYSLDRTDGELGLLYSQKTPLPGSDAERLKLTLDQAIAAAKKLEGDPVFAGKLSFDRNKLQLVINDRAAAPNTPETFQKISALAESVLKSNGARCQHRNNPKLRFGINITLNNPWG